MDLEQLKEGVHCAETWDLIKSHLEVVLDTEDPGNDHVLRVSKYHIAQLYGASALFGYSLRRAAKRFKLARSAGISPKVCAVNPH